MPKTNKGQVLWIDGLNPLLKMLGRLPTDLQKEVRDASDDIARDLVGKAKGNASTELQRLAASGLRVKRDRVPVVRAGGTLRGRTKVQDVFYGAEFGGQGRPSTQQFPPHRGKLGYFLYPAARQRGSAYFLMWASAVDRAFKQWDNRQALKGD